MSEHNQSQLFPDDPHRQEEVEVENLLLPILAATWLSYWDSVAREIKYPQARQKPQQRAPASPSE